MSDLSPNVSLPFSVYEIVYSLLSLCFADMEVQKMKKAMESLMAANEEKVVLSHKFLCPLHLKIIKELGIYCC